MRWHGLSTVRLKAQFCILEELEVNPTATLTICGSSGYRSLLTTEIWAASALQQRTNRASRAPVSQMGGHTQCGFHSYPGRWSHAPQTQPGLGGRWSAWGRSAAASRRAQQRMPGEELQCPERWRYGPPLGLREFHRPPCPAAGTQCGGRLVASKEAFEAMSGGGVTGARACWGWGLSDASQAPALGTVGGAARSPQLLEGSRSGLRG